MRAEVVGVEVEDCDIDEADCEGGGRDCEVEDCV